MWGTVCIIRRCCLWRICRLTIFLSWICLRIFWTLLFLLFRDLLLFFLLLYFQFFVVILLLLNLFNNFIVINFWLFHYLNVKERNNIIPILLNYRNKLLVLIKVFAVLIKIVGNLFVFKVLIQFSFTFAIIKIHVQIQT